MLLLKAHLSIAAGHRRAFLACIHELVTASLTEEGCCAFECLEEVAHPNSFIVLEEWNDRESLDRHEQSPHLAAFKSIVGEMIVSRRETRVYAIDTIQAL